MMLLITIPVYPKQVVTATNQSSYINDVTRLMDLYIRNRSSTLHLLGLYIWNRSLSTLRFTVAISMAHLNLYIRKQVKLQYFFE